MSLHNSQRVTQELESSASGWRAIVMMDVVGFTTLMERNLGGTLSRWEKLCRSCIEPAIERHHGELLRKLGDGVLAAFPQAREAVACVLEIQKRCSSCAHDAGALSLRAAIDGGIVVKDWDGELQGTALNITSRLQKFAAPGGVVVSAVIKERAGGIDEEYEDLGDLVLEGIERRVRSYSLLERPGWLLEGGRPSIAVLPFDECASEHGGYIGDGIVEGIVNALAANQELAVVSRSSTLAFRRGVVDMSVVREALGVDYIVSGTIRPAGDDISITAELSHSKSRHVLCSDKKVYRRVNDIFDFQDQVSQQIVPIIGASLRKAERTRVAAKRPENLSAYEWFLRGLDRVYRLEREQFERARDMFDRAIERDPGYAAPYAYRALWHAIRIGQGWSTDLEADRTDCRKFSDEAVDRDDLDASALALCGHVRSIQLQEFQKAFEHFDRAIAASPNAAIVWTRSSPTCSYVGDWQEGRRRALEGLRLSPLDRHRFFTHTVLCLAAYTGQSYDEAIEWGRKAMSENPSFTANLRLLCAATAAAGRMAEAKEVGATLLAADPNFHIEPFCASYAYKEPERREQLAEHLRRAGLPN
jgi:adenylate cyclase